MSTLIQLLETRDDCFLASVTASSDSDELKELGQIWATATDPWALEQLRIWIGQAFSTRGHETLIRQLLRSGEEADNKQLMATLFVTFDRAIRRRRINGPVEKLITGRRRGTVCSIRTLGWFRRRVWAWFRDLSERDSSAYVQTACFALRQYHDDDFATGERILDNRSLMKLGFYGSPQIAIGPVHVCLTSDSSVNTLTPAPWAPEVWSEPVAVCHLIELAGRSQARFIRWWAATICSQNGIRISHDVDKRILQELVVREEPFQQPLFETLLTDMAHALSGDDWLGLVGSACPDLFDTVLKSFAASVRTDQIPDQVILDICCRMTPEHPRQFVANAARCLHQRRSRIEFSDRLMPFLELALQTPGCSRLRCWLVSGFLSLVRTSEEGALRHVDFIACLLPTMSRSAKLETVSALMTAQNESAVIAAAIAERCPELQCRPDRPQVMKLA